MHIVRLASWPAVLSLGIASEWWGYRGGGVALAAADLSVGLALFVGALLVSTRGPHRLIALLFAATGVAWFLGTVSPPLLYLHRAGLVLLILAYPTGRLQSWVARLVVAFAVVDAVVVPIAQNDAVTLVLAATVVVTAGLGLRDPQRRRARALATGCAVGVAAALSLGSGHLAGSAGLSDTTFLLLYEAALLLASLVLAIAIVAARSGQAAIADLVVELGTGRHAETLRDALARAFGDPALGLAYRVGDSYVDSEGLPIPLADPEGSRAVTVIDRDGEPIAALFHGNATAPDPRVQEAAAAALRIAAANARLQVELRGRVRELAASRRRMIEASDNQRRRLERRLRQAAEVHLEEMRLALERALHIAPSAVVAGLESVRRELEQAVADVHDLARGIHPLTLTERGLEPALAELALTSATPVSIGAPAERFPMPVEAAAYFVCAEALANVGKYAHADRASVEVQRGEGLLRVAVTDNGVGGADPARGSGLRGLADRVDAVGGHLTVTSPTLGGTRVVAEIPLEQPV